MIGRIFHVWRACHDPDVVFFGAAYHSGRIIGIQIDDAVFGLDRPDELHAPDGLGRIVANEPSRAISLPGTVESARMVSKGGGNGAVGFQAVGLVDVVCVFFHEGGNIGDDRTNRP